MYRRSAGQLWLMFTGAENMIIFIIAESVQSVRFNKYAQPVLSDDGRNLRKGEESNPHTVL